MRRRSADLVSVSESARAKANTWRTPGGLPVHGFTALLVDLATLTLDDVI